MSTFTTQVKDYVVALDKPTFTVQDFNIADRMRVASSLKALVRKGFLIEVAKQERSRNKSRRSYITIYGVKNAKSGVVINRSDAVGYHRIGSCILIDVDGTIHFNYDPHTA